MKKISLLFLLVLCIHGKAFAQWPPHINVIILEKDVKSTAEGDLKDGKTMDLAWGYHSANSCFPESARENFRGNHVLYAVYVAPHTNVTITLTPTSDSTKMSLYAYMIGANNFTSVAPNLHGCIGCKSDYGQVKIATPPKNKPNPKTDKPNKPTIATNPEVAVKSTNVRKIELRAVGNQAYHLIIGVAGGGQAVVQGAYTLEVLEK